MDISQLVSQAAEIFTKVFNEITHFANNVAMSEIFIHLLSFLRLIVRFFVIALEAIVRVLKFFIH